MRDSIWWRQVKDFDELYLCGFKISRWIQVEGFHRFATWTGEGICHELAAVSMMALKRNKTAILYQGYDYDSNGKLTKHAWVEFKVPFVGWCVCDLMWINGITKRRRYRKWFPDRVAKWQCSYENFWKLEFSQGLYERIHRPESSYIMNELTLYMEYGTENFGFCKEIQELHVAPPDNCGEGFMQPYKVGNEICWASTLRDFVKHPRAEKPQMRSIRLAWRAYKDFQVMLEQFERAINSSAHEGVAS